MDVKIGTKKFTKSIFYNDRLIQINRIVAFIVFTLTTIIYVRTAAPTVSFWDCGEFIAACQNLSVTHPPGAPLYLLIGRIFSMLPVADDIALRVNYLSCICSSLTVLFLYLSIVRLIDQTNQGLTTTSDWITAISCALIGSLTLAFSHSFWYNAVEAEVYAASTFLTSILIWLILLWAEKHNQTGNTRYLLLISYILGLAVGIHLLTILILPFLIMICFIKKYQFKMKSALTLIVVTAGIFLTIYPGIVKYLPYVAKQAGLIELLLIIGAIFAVVIWSISRNKKMLSAISISVLLFIIGYSTYSTTIIRSNLNPNIDINNPENAENFYKYINREQYGDHSILDRKTVWHSSPNKKDYTSTWDYFWAYQINNMYVRYFLWQFVGRADNERDWTSQQLYALPFILGLVGIYWHFKNNYRMALAVITLFFTTGLAMVLYLNQADPQPRERDYSYVVSFLAFSIWVGMGYAGIVQLLKNILAKIKFSVHIGLQILTFILLLIPLFMLARNYNSHDRSGRYIAWDYAYNTLQTCEPKAILFTGGDNDTYPLWYLQEVEGIRTDIRIVNLELLNTDWYVKQLRDFEPKVPMHISDTELKQLGFIPWKKQMIALNVPKQTAVKYRDELYNYSLRAPLNLPKKISFTVNPSHTTPYGSVLCVRDSMILRILQANKWRKPVYFSASAPSRSYPVELRRYFRLEGMAYKLVPYKDWAINPSRLEKNLLEIYQYRGLAERDVYFDRSIKAYIQNYRSAFLELAHYHARLSKMEKAKYIISQMNKRITDEAIPWTNKYLKLMKYAYEVALESLQIDTLTRLGCSENDLLFIAEYLNRSNLIDHSTNLFKMIYESNPKNVQALSRLINNCEKLGNYNYAISLLQNWLIHNPNDDGARKKLEQFERNLF
jgi:hypothetical protein